MNRHLRRSAWLGATALVCVAVLAARAQTTSSPAAAVSTTGAAHAGLDRWAILATPAVQASGLPELLTAALSGTPGLTLVERDQVATVLKELRLDRALGADATGERLKLGELLKADALLILAEEQRGKDHLLRAVISDATVGARLSTDFLAYPPAAGGSSGDALSAPLVALVRDTRSRFPHGVQQIVGVPNFVSRDLTHDFDYLQDPLAYVLQSGFSAWPGCALLEVEEAQAIQRELDVGGARLGPRLVPCFVEGEYRVTPALAPTTQVMGASPTDDPNGERAGTSSVAGRRLAAIQLTLVVKDAGGLKATVERRADTVEALAAWLQRDAPRQVWSAAGRDSVRDPASSSAPGNPTTQPGLTDAQQRALLAARADTFARLSDYDHSIALREAALLIWADDADQRRALVSDYERLLDGHVRERPRGPGTSRGCAATPRGARRSRSSSNT